MITLKIHVLKLGLFSGFLAESTVLYRFLTQEPQLFPIFCIKKEISSRKKTIHRDFRRQGGKIDFKAQTHEMNTDHNALRHDS